MNSQLKPPACFNFFKQQYLILDGGILFLIEADFIDSYSLIKSPNIVYCITSLGNLQTELPVNNCCFEFCEILFLCSFENFLPEQIFKAIETSSTDFLIDVTTSLDFNSISYNADVNMHHVNLQENYKNVPISINFSGNRKEIEIRKAAIDLRDILFTYSGTLQYRNPLENLEGNLQIFEQNQKDQLVTDINVRNIQDQIVAKIDFP